MIKVKLNKKEDFSINSIDLDKKVRDYINSLRFLDLVDTAFIKQELNLDYDYDYLRHHFKKIFPNNYVKLKGNKLYFGSKKTIEHIKKYEKVIYENKQSGSKI